MLLSLEGRPGTMKLHVTLMCLACLGKVLSQSTDTSSQQSSQQQQQQSNFQPGTGFPQGWSGQGWSGMPQGNMFVPPTTGTNFQGAFGNGFMPQGPGGGSNFNPGGMNPGGPWNSFRPPPGPVFNPWANAGGNPMGQMGQMGQGQMGQGQMGQMGQMGQGQMGQMGQMGQGQMGQGQMGQMGQGQMGQMGQMGQGQMGFPGQNTGGTNFPAGQFGGGQWGQMGPNSGQFGQMGPGSGQFGQMGPGSGQWGMPFPDPNFGNFPGGPTGGFFPQNNMQPWNQQWTQFGMNGQFPMSPQQGGGNFGNFPQQQWYPQQGTGGGWNPWQFGGSSLGNQWNSNQGSGQMPWQMGTGNQWNPNQGQSWQSQGNMGFPQGQWGMQQPFGSNSQFGQQWGFNPVDYMTGDTCGAGDAHSSGTPDLTFGFCEGQQGTGMAFRRQSNTVNVPDGAQSRPIGSF